MSATHTTPHATIVLKFGGSVLTDHASLADAVHEITRWRDGGLRVVAVVSALFGDTDRLLAEARALCPDASPETIAGIVGLGECRSAAGLVALLERAGQRAALLLPGALALRARGRADDAWPEAINARLLESALARHGTAVVPGFVAHTDTGEVALLGRGGSDLTALFLAHTLGARCRLVKDVDGLYERDPKSPGPAPARYDRAHYDTALRLDAGIIQPKAVRFARSVGLAFELGALGAPTPWGSVSVIGPEPTRLAEPAALVG